MSTFPDDWQRKAKLTIQSSKVDSTLTDFPVQITKNSVPSDMLDADGDNPCQADGGDIRITSDAAGTTQLPCEVSYMSTDNDPSNGNCNIFTKLPTISSSVDTDFYIWFNTVDTDTQPAGDSEFGSGNVWDSNFQTVIHFDEAVNNDAGGYPDSTSNNLHATGVSMSIAAADADGGGLAADFNGSADYMTIAAPSIGTAFTASFQVNHDALGTQKYINDINGGKYFEVGAVTSGKLESLWNWNTNSSYASTTASLTATEWEYVSFSASAADGSKFNTDGATNGTGTITTYAGITTAYNIGRRENGTSYFNGKMGEYRMSDIVRADAWKKAEYENYKNNAAFLVASASESASGGGGGGSTHTNIPSDIVHSKIPIL